MIGDFNNEINFPYKLLLTNTQVLRLRQASANNSTTNIKLSKTQMSKMVQLGVFLGLLSLTSSFLNPDKKIKRLTEIFKKKKDYLISSLDKGINVINSN